MFRPGRREAAACLHGVLLLGLGGCTALLDFGGPISGPDEIDADISVDGGPTADASSAICQTFEPNGTTGDAPTITPMDIASATCSSTDTDIYAFVIVAD